MEGSALSAITSMVPEALSMATAVWDFIVANPLLCFFGAGTLIRVGIGLFSGAKAAI